MTKKNDNQLQIQVEQTKPEIPFHTQYDPPPSSGIAFKDDSLTQQQFKEDTDINNIIKNMGMGIMPTANPLTGSFGDFSEPMEYLEAMNTVTKANEQFAQLPAEIRHRFGNNPQSFLDFVTNPNNVDEMVKMGLATIEQRDRVQEYIEPEPEVQPVAEQKPASRRKA